MEYQLLLLEDNWFGQLPLRVCFPMLYQVLEQKFEPMDIVGN